MRRSSPRGPGLCALLATSSVAALLIGTGAPPAYAALPCQSGGIALGGASQGSVTNPAAISCIFIFNSTISGNVTNAGSGTITTTNGPPSSTGITINNSTITGTVSNAGVISASGNGILITNNATVVGGISNVATIVATEIGIDVNGVSSFAGGISNSGTISAGGAYGIVVSASAFSGGITNSGTILGGSQAGISVSNTTSFSGWVSNAGMISALGAGIVVNSVSTFASGVGNSGTIAASGNGIYVAQVSVFSGNIANDGTITAFVNGIIVGGTVHSGTPIAVSSFGGDITNNGTITTSSGNGIIVGGKAVGSGFVATPASVMVSTFAGSISNGGVIAVAGAGVVVGGAATGTGTSVTVSSFGGNIVNSGTITAFGPAAIVVGGEATGLFASVTIGAFGNGVTNTGTIRSANAGILIGGNASGTLASINIGSFGGGVSNSGSITARTGIEIGGFATGGGSIAISNFSGGVTNSGRIVATGSRGIGILVAGTTFAAGPVTISTFSGGISNSGTISATGADGIGIDVVQVQTFLNGITNSGTITAGAYGVGIVVGATYFGGNVSNSGLIRAGTGIYVCDCATFAGGAISNTGTISGTGGIAINATIASSPITIDQAGGLISGAIMLSPNADVVNITGGTIVGNIVGQGTNDTINFALATPGTYTDSNTFTTINQVNVESGTTLVVNSTGNSATNVDVQSGGTLAGIGSIDPLPTTVVEIQSGGTFAPGTPGGFGTFNIAGTLTFDVGSFYAINIAPGAGNNSNAIVNGTANLNSNGTVVVMPEPGHYNDAIYTILSPTTRNGTFVSAVTVTGTFVDGTPTLDYASNGPNDVDLDVTGFSLVSAPAGTNLNQNQQNTLNGINAGILDSPANVPLLPGFVNLSPLSGPALGNALTELAGQDGTGAQTSAFQLMQDFLNLLSDPTAGGGGGGGTNGPQQFAPDDQASLPPAIAEAYNHVLRSGTPQPAESFEQRWSAWASGFGGSGTIDGNATVGSSNVTATDYGYAAGMTYHATPATSYGFALAGGGTSWNLAQSLGSGRSDSFQAGVYGTSHFGPAYLSGALAFANHWFTTNRIALGDQLTANFQGQSYAARGEAGYRYAVPLTGYIIGVTPYAALQVQDFHTPGYSETDLTGGGFGLTYGSMNATDTRSELGARLDNLTVWDGMPLVLRGRLAWAHDWVSDPALGAVFQALPGSNFTVNGAAPPKNSALTTSAAELHFTPNWTAMAKFDGDFGSGAQTYAGTGTIRYSW